MASSRFSPLRPSLRFPSAPGRSDRSPDRNVPLPSYQDFDPLLRNLSPESTLQALSSTDAVPKNEKAAHDILTRSISQVSPAERALAIRAAIAAQKLSQWYKEVQSWIWPKRMDAQLGKGFIPPSNFPGIEYYGSLPADVVQLHEKRIEEIRDGMDELDVEELKEHVLNAHIPSRSRPSSSNSTMSVPPPLSYVQLSDFTAVITATILRALPYLTRLNSLLSTWDVRLMVLRQTPGLLRGLQLTRFELNTSMNLLKTSRPLPEDHSLYSRSNFHAKHAELQSMVSAVGRRMDVMLDALEGREDSLPENWIDDLEAIESDFSTWVVEAERRAVENEWMRTRAPKPGPEPEPEPEQTPTKLPDAVEDAKSSVHMVEPQREQARSFVMETIKEEPNVASASVTNDESSDDSDSGPSEVHTSTLEAHSTTLQEKSKLKSISLDSGKDVNLEDSRSTIGVAEILNENQNAPVVDSMVPLNDKESSQDDSAHVFKSSEEPACASPNKEISEAQPETAVSPTPEVRSEQTLFLTRSGTEHNLQEGPSPALRQDSTENQSSHVDKSPDISAEAVPDPPTESKESTNANDTAKFVPTVPESVKTSSRPEENAPPLVRIEPSEETETQEHRPELQRVPTEDEAATLASIIGKSATTEIPASTVSVNREDSPAQTSSTPSKPSEPAEPSMPSGTKQSAPQQPVIEEAQPDRSPPLKQPLESPIKLSKSRPGRLSLEKGGKTHRRLPSNGSAGSAGDCPSLASSPEVRELHTGSSNGTPLFVDTSPYPQAYPHSRILPSKNDHSLREDHLLRLESQKPSPHAALKHNRTVSLPLQRFIDEKLDLNYEGETGPDAESSVLGRRSSALSADWNFQNEQETSVPHKGESTAPTNDVRRLAIQQLELRGGKKTPVRGPSVESSKARLPNRQIQSKKPVQHAQRPERPASAAATRLRKQMTAHPSLESLRLSSAGRQDVGDASSNSGTPKSDSRASTPSKQHRQPKKSKDQLDEKISSILTTLPGRIRLVSSGNNETDTSSVVSSFPPRTQERFRSESPVGNPSRCGTPAPSMTLTPAVPRRRHSHAPEESSVKLYHLHRGGKAPATKLFVRTVGENGERVMVRVGGGWADLGEYLREYAIHHGSRNVSETPRVEVQGISPRDSPGSLLAPSSNTGRTTPSRPQSVLSNRPSSSLNVRKMRRSSNVSDTNDLRAVSASEAMNVSFSPKSPISSRRLSVSSNNSYGATSFASEAHHGSSSHSPSTTIAAGSARSTPLGLAGPRSRHAAISPESEAWVEDVLGQARRSASGQKPPKTYLSPEERDHISTVSGLPKVRSVSDIGSVGTSRRVVLRGLGNRKT